MLLCDYICEMKFFFWVQIASVICWNCWLHCGCICLGMLVIKHWFVDVEFAKFIAFDMVLIWNYIWCLFIYIWYLWILGYLVLMIFFIEYYWVLVVGYWGFCTICYWLLDMDISYQICGWFGNLIEFLLLVILLLILQRLLFFVLDLIWICKLGQYVVIFLLISYYQFLFDWIAIGYWIFLWLLAFDFVGFFFWTLMLVNWLLWELLGLIRVVTSWLLCDL